MDDFTNGSAHRFVDSLKEKQRKRDQTTHRVGSTVCVHLWWFSCIWLKSVEFVSLCAYVYVLFGWKQPTHTTPFHSVQMSSDDILDEIVSKKCVL